MTDGKVPNIFFIHALKCIQNKGCIWKTGKQKGVYIKLRIPIALDTIMAMAGTTSALVKIMSIFLVK